jgi:hypothetical protein
MTMNIYHDTDNVLSEPHFLKLHYAIVHYVGLEAAVLLAHLLNVNEYCDIDVDSALNTQKDLQTATMLTPHKQMKALIKLREVGFVAVCKCGIPAKNHYSINEWNIKKFLKDVQKRNRPAKQNKGGTE